MNKHVQTKRLDQLSDEDLASICGASGKQILAPINTVVNPALTVGNFGTQPIGGVSPVGGLSPIINPSISF